ncbi:MAG: hypothetical protein AAF802_20535 [Planctomycetota bacterium]
MTSSAMVALFVSFNLAVWSAGMEPFYGPFNLTHAVVSLVGGGAVLIFWFAWTVGLLIAVSKRTIPLTALFLLLLSIPGLLLGTMVVVGYLADRSDWHDTLSCSDRSWTSC